MNKFKLIFATLILTLLTVFATAKVFAQTAPTGTLIPNPTTVTIANSGSTDTGTSNISASWNNFTGTPVLCVAEPGTSGGADSVMASWSGASDTKTSNAPWITSGKTYTFKLFDNSSIACGGTQFATTTVTGANPMTGGTPSGSVSFRTGDVVTAVNNTTRNADWGDPVAAAPGQIIEFRMIVQNMTEGSVARDVLVKAHFASAASSNPQMTMSASANGVTVSDTATVNVSGGNTHLFVYESGHTRVFSPACPGGCNADDSFRDGGPINIGHLAFGESAQILFKAGITNPGPVTPAAVVCVPGTQTVNINQNANFTATGGNGTFSWSAPNGTPTSGSGASFATQYSTNGSKTVTVTSNGQNATCTVTVNVTGGGGTGGTTNNNTNTNTNTQNQTVNVTQAAAAQPAVAGAKVTALPKTGLPLTALLGLGGLPLGLALRKFSKGPAAENAPESIWEDRQIKISS